MTEKEPEKTEDNSWKPPQEEKERAGSKTEESGSKTSPAPEPRTVKTTKKSPPPESILKPAVRNQEIEDITPSGIPLLFILICALGMVFILCGTMVASFTYQTESEPDIRLYNNESADLYFNDLEDHQEGKETAQMGFRNGVLLYNVGLFFLLGGLFSAATFSKEMKWELRAVLILAAALIMGLACFRIEAIPIETIPLQIILGGT